MNHSPEPWQAVIDVTISDDCPCIVDAEGENVILDRCVSEEDARRIVLCLGFLSGLENEELGEVLETDPAWVRDLRQMIRFYAAQLRNHQGKEPLRTPPQAC